MGRRDIAPKTHITSNILRSNREEWEHQVKLLERRISRFEKDYNVEINYKIPEAPKDGHWKRAIERIKSVRRGKLEKYAYQKNEQGEVKVTDKGEAVKFVRPERGKAKEAKERARRERETGQRVDTEQPEEPNVYDVVLENLKNYIEGFNENRNKSLQEWSKGKLLSLLESAIERESAEEIASRAETMAGLADLAQAALWQSKQERAEMHIRGFANVLYGRSSSRVDKIFMERIYEEVGMYG